ncbi:MAG TPA: zinc ABC transporter substrate-binding protein, partial [Candidatus Caenarcaniphilales bacterium]
MKVSFLQISADWLRGWLAVAVIGLGFSGCTLEGSNSSPALDPRPRVVATSTIIADLSAAVGADEIQLTGILEPGTDPHVYEPVPADSRDL